MGDCWKKRGQYAIEYIIIIGISLLILIPLVFTYQSMFGDALFSVSTEKAAQISNMLSQTVMETYYMGEGAVRTIHIEIPDVKDSYIGDNEIGFIMKNDNDVFSIVKINVTGSIPNNQGKYDIIVKSMGDYVWIGPK